MILILDDSPETTSADYQGRMYLWKSKVTPTPPQKKVIKYVLRKNIVL